MSNMNANVNSFISLRFILEKNKLSRSNFLDWYRNLRIVLKQERKLYVLEGPIPKAPSVGSTMDEQDAYVKHQRDSLDVKYLMLDTMNSKLQKQHKSFEALDMIVHLKTLFKKESRHERFEISKALFQYKMVEGSPVGSDVLKMIGYIESLERLGFPLGLELATDLILQSLPDNFSQFIMTYNMFEKAKSLPMLASMLRVFENNLNIGKENAIMMVDSCKWKDKNFVTKNNKGKGNTKHVVHALKCSGGVAKKRNGFHCGMRRHQRRYCH